MAIAVDEVKKMKVQELKDELTKRGLDSTGLKAALAERLEESIKADTEGPADGGAQAPATDLVESTEPPAASTAAANGEVKTDPAAAQAETEGGKIVYKDPAEEELAKKKARAARFGMPLNLSEDKKAAMRAQRFGLETKAGEKKQKTGATEPAKKQPSTAELAAELEKKKARAARFNMPVKTNAEEEKLRLKAREERFTDQLAKLPASTTGNAKPTGTAASLEAKKKARAERFGIKT